MPRPVNDTEWHPGDRQTQHDWSTLLDGQKWELIRGIDYQCSTLSMRTLMHRRCAEHGLLARTRKIKTKDGREGIQVVAVPKKSKRDVA